MAILTSRIFASFLVCGAVLLSSFAIPVLTVPMTGAAHAQEAHGEVDWELARLSSV